MLERLRHTGQFCFAGSQDWPLLSGLLSCPTRIWAQALCWEPDERIEPKKECIMKIIRGILILLLPATIFISGCAQMAGSGLGSSPIIDRITARGELIVGMAGDMPPMHMTTKAGEIIGLEADMARMMADSMGVDLRIETMPFSELLGAVDSGQVDLVISSVTITPQRNMKVAFVGPYFVSGKALLTKMDSLASAEKPDQLNRSTLTLTVLKGSTSQLFVETLIPEAQLAAADTYDDAIQLVLQDKADALIADLPFCLFSVLRYPEADLVSLINPWTYEPLGIVLPKGDPHLINWTTNFFNILEGTGGLDLLKDLWFKERSWLDQLPK